MRVGIAVLVLVIYNGIFLLTNNPTESFLLLSFIWLKMNFKIYGWDFYVLHFVAVLLRRDKPIII